MRPSQKFVEVLLKLGYEALSDNNFTHHDIEGVENMDPASTGRDSRGETGVVDGAADEKEQSVKGINPKSIIAGHIESYGDDMDEDKGVKPSVLGVMEHRVAQDMLAYRTNLCTAIAALLLDFLNSPKAVEEEAEMLGRIYGKESMRVAGSRSISLESYTTHTALVIPPSLSLTAVPVQDDKEDDKEEREEEGKVLDPDSDASPVTVGSPSQTGSDSSSGSREEDNDRSRGSSKVGSDDDRVGNAISNLFGSIIKTFRSDKVPEDGNEDTATSPLGDRVKSNTAVSLVMSCHILSVSTLECCFSSWPLISLVQHYHSVYLHLFCCANISSFFYYAQYSRITLITPSGLGSSRRRAAS